MDLIFSKCITALDTNQTVYKDLTIRSSLYADLFKRCSLQDNKIIFFPALNI